MRAAELCLHFAPSSDTLHSHPGFLISQKLPEPCLGTAPNPLAFPCHTSCQILAHLYSQLAAKAHVRPYTCCPAMHTQLTLTLIPRRLSRKVFLTRFPGLGTMVGSFHVFGQ